MATFAVINKKDETLYTVINVIVTDNKEQAESDLNVTLVEYTPENPAAIGWDFDGTNFIPPISEEPTE
jgi:carbonic anhydrase